MKSPISINTNSRKKKSTLRLKFFFILPPPRSEIDYETSPDSFKVMCLLILAAYRCKYINTVGYVVKTFSAYENA